MKRTENIKQAKVIIAGSKSLICSGAKFTLGKQKYAIIAIIVAIDL
jgi:hypothetical protein